MSFADNNDQPAGAVPLFDPFASSGFLCCLTYQPGAATAIGSPNLGTSPAATLTVQANNTPCPGFADSSSTFELYYDVPAGTQLSYHPFPGLPHDGTKRVAYLPDTAEGRQLLTRIKVAFLRGLIFTIGRSLTSGRDHQVCWTEIPHKTGLHGGPFDFPDGNYIPKAHTKLCKLRIPDAYACAAILQQHLQGSGASTMALPPPFASIPAATSLNETLAYTAPKTLSGSFKNVIHPIPSTAKGWDGENCAVCLEALQASEQNLEQIGTCLHVLHRDCLENCLHNHPRCPVCRTPMGDKPQGKCPSGTMSISSSSQTCPGFRCGTITIQYDLPSGTQTCYHDHPGHRFSGAHRVAYLPDNQQGRDLLERLKYAWMHGLTFRVGTSLTTNVPNQTTWASIHHKTSLSGGAHGFPDPNYIGNCNSSLDALHVPSIDELRQRAASPPAAAVAASSLALPDPHLYDLAPAANVFAGSAAAATDLPPPSSSNNPYGATAPPPTYVTPPVSSGASGNKRKGFGALVRRTSQK